MFIESLEFTIPLDLCDVFSTLKQGPRSDLEFPASVNSYGTTQDANIQVMLRSNKLTFKVDGVSSNASMISKSECKTLKLSVFDVDCSLIPPPLDMNSISTLHLPHTLPSKRTHSVSLSSPPVKMRRTFSENTDLRVPPIHPRFPVNNHHNHEQPKSQNDIHVNVKQEPEDPDLIEIEPDHEPETDDVEPKKEAPFMQIDFTSSEPYTQTSQATLDRLAHPQSSHSQSPASSSSSFQQNVPHVPDYAEPGPSQQSRHGDQGADDYLVFQGDEEIDDNEADYSNDENCSRGFLATDKTFLHKFSTDQHNAINPHVCYICRLEFDSAESVNKHLQSHIDMEGLPRCLFEDCGRLFETDGCLQKHITQLHEHAKPVFCPGCSKQFHFNTNLLEHSKSCPQYLKICDKRKTAQCDECGKMFASKPLKREHMDSQHRGVTFTCACGQTYAYRTGLARHRKSTGH